MVDKIERIAATSSSRPTHVNDSISITSEPDGVWVAHRQSAITSGLEERSHSDQKDNKSEGDPSGEHKPECSDLVAETGQSSDEKLSGESERIGNGNWDDDVPFGEHVGYL